MKTLLLAFGLTFSWVHTLSAQPYQVGETLYVWAKSGLHLRDTPSLSGKVLKTLPYGAALELKQCSGEVIEVEIIKDAESNGQYFPNFKLNGHWLLVRTGDLQAYVFEGYVSTLPPLNINSFKDGSYHCEDLITYGQRTFDIDPSYQPARQVHKRAIWKHFGKEMIWKKYEDRSWGYQSTMLANISLREAYLLFNILQQFERQSQQAQTAQAYRLLKKAQHTWIFSLGQPGDFVRITKREKGWVEIYTEKSKPTPKS